MPYIGNSPANVGNYQIVDDISSTFNGTLTSFALTVSSSSITPAKSGQLLVGINGVMQEPDDTGTEGFLVSGSNIVFSSAPATGSTFWCVFQGQNVDIGTPSDGVVDTIHIKDNAITADKLANAINSAIAANTTAIGNIPPATISEVSDQTNSSTGYLDIPAGSTAQRPGSPNGGMLRFNTDFNKLEQYSGTEWITIDTPPLIAGATYPSGLTGLDPAGNETITITGSNFSGCTVKFKAADGTLFSAPTVTTNSTILITVITPPLVIGDYDIVVSNDSGAAATLTPGLSVSGLPAWSTSAGTMGSYVGDTAVSITVLAQEGSDAIVYSITSGALPTGLSLSGDTISGTATMPAGDTTSTFTMSAVDDEGQTTDRSFNITVTYVHVINYSVKFGNISTACPPVG